MAGHQAVGGAGEAPVGEQGHGLPKPLAHERGCHAQHLAHSGPARRALVADHHHVARLDALLLHRGERVLLALEHARRPALVEALEARQLHDAAVGREIAAQDREAAGGLDGIVEGPHHLLARLLLRFGGLLADRASGDGDGVGVQDAGVEQPLGHEANPAGAEQVRGDEPASRLQVGE